jgi:hypothetical protein
MSKAHVYLIAALAGLAASGAAARSTGSLPQRVGQCVETRIKTVETRLVDGNTPIAGSGSAVSFVNGGYQVSYDTVRAIEHSRPGDPVRMCLISVPHPCPRGDDRGRLYKTTNLRTHRDWVLRDAEHMCGGA